MIDCYFSSEWQNSERLRSEERIFQSCDAKKTDGRQTHTGGDATCVALSHMNTATLGKHQTQPPLFCQSPRPIVSDPSLPSIIISPAPLNPFKCQVDGGLICRYRLTTGGLITREAATSEHCVESRRHTGRGGRKCSLSCHHHHHHQSSPPHPYQPSHPQQKQSERLCGRHSRAEEREEIVKRRWKEWRRVDKAHMPSPRLSNTMPDVSHYATMCRKKIV